MPLEIFIDPARAANIKDFSLDSPEYRTDVLNITEENWSHIDAHLRETLERGSLYNYVHFLWSLHILDKDRVPELSDLTLSKLRSLVQQSRSDAYRNHGASWMIFAANLARYNGVVPDSSQYLADPVDKNLISEYLVELLRKKIEAPDEWYRVTSLAAHLRMIQPAWPLPEGAWEKFTAAAQVVRHQELPESFLAIAANMRIATNEDNPAITEEEWTVLNEILGEWRENNEWGDFLKMAARMKIAAAEKVLVENFQITAVMPQVSESNPVPSLPQVRNF